MNTIDIFIKTHAKDFILLDHSLRSIKKWAKGFNEIVVVTEDKLTIPEMAGCHVHSVSSAGMDAPVEGRSTLAGYEHQKAIKCLWPALSDAQAVLQLDSDCVLTDSLSVNDLFLGHRPVWTQIPWSEVDREYEDTWRAGSEWFFGRSSAFSYVVDPGFIITKELASKFGQYLATRYSMTAVDLFARQPKHRLSVYEILGIFADRMIDLDAPYIFLPPSEFSLPIMQHGLHIVT